MSLIKRVSPMKKIYPCKVCDHPEAKRINEGLLTGTMSMSAIAKEFKMSSETVHKHKHKHLAEQIKEVQKVRGKDIKSGLMDIERRTEQILAKAMDTNDARTALAAIQRREAQLRFMAELCGELQDKAPNARAEERRKQQIDRAVEDFIAKAADEGIEINREQAIEKLVAVDPEIAKYIN